MMKEYDDTFLARWMNNDLSEVELDDFKNHPDFLLYNRIATKSQELVAPTYDKSALFTKVQGSIDNTRKKGKVRSLYSTITIAIAASVAILFGVFQFINSPTTYTTDFGEQMAVHLPDGSEVILNSKSEIAFNEKNWNVNRKVELIGEGFFKVKKGSKFTVETEKGNVAVLGTQFNVTTDKNLMEVSCYEGKVKVSSQKKVIFLTRGKAYRNINGTSEEWEFNDEEPSWKNGESSFVSIPLKYVIKAIENQYSVEVDTEKINIDHKFTGAFTHKNLSIALETVFKPLKINATIVDKNRITLVEE